MVPGMFSGLLAAVMLAAAPGEPLLGTEGGLGVGVWGQGFTQRGGRWGDASVGPLGTGRVVWRGVTADATLAFEIPVTQGGISSAWLGVLRLGYTGERFSVVAGAAMQYARLAEPTTQWLPSLRAEGTFGEWGLALGVFDYCATAPLHLSFQLGDWSVGYVAPLGAVVTARLRLLDGFGVQLAALAYRLANTDVAMLTLSAVLGPRAGVLR